MKAGSLVQSLVDRGRIDFREEEDEESEDDVDPVVFEPIDGRPTSPIPPPPSPNPSYTFGPGFIRSIKDF